MTEALYIKKILKGDVEQYTYFIDKYKDMAFTLAFRITKSREDAEEIVQDAFLKAYNGLRSFRADASFSTWLYKIVVNTSLTKTRKKLSPVVHVDLAEGSTMLIDNTEMVYEGLQQSEQRKIIEKVLAEMEIEDSLLLVLYYLNEQSIEEIRDITGIPAENIKMKLHRARKKMYSLLDNKLKAELKYLL